MIPKVGVATVLEADDRGGHIDVGERRAAAMSPFLVLNMVFLGHEPLCRTTWTP
jgi:hypothetical protein